MNERGHFLQPESSEDALQDLEDLSSPIQAFVRECCDLGPGLKVEIETLFAAWQTYCGATGRYNVGTFQNFGRDVRAAYPTLRMTQPRVDGRRNRVYEGIALRPDANGGTLGTRSNLLHA